MRGSDGIELNPSPDALDRLIPLITVGLPTPVEDGPLQLIPPIGRVAPGGVIRVLGK